MTNGIFIKLWFPDYLSLFRILAAIILVLLACYDFRLEFSWLLLIALVTDALDGYIARKRKKPPTMGLYWIPLVMLAFFWELIPG